MAVIEVEHEKNSLKHKPFDRDFKDNNESVLINKKGKSAPLYLQIYSDIALKIEEEVLKHGDSLPTEQALMEYYNVSRVTIRKALTELINDGIVKRDHSKSATVALKKPRKNMARLTSLREDIINAGLNPTSFITLVQQVDANDTLASIMNIPVGEKLIFFHRIRYGSGTPIAVQDVHIREKYCTASLIKNLGNDSIYDILEQDLGLVIDYADLMLTAKMPTKKQCQELNISGDAPLLLMKRTAYLNNSDTLEYAETYYVTSRYEWTLKSYRDSSVKTENR